MRMLFSNNKQFFARSIVLLHFINNIGSKIVKLHSSSERERKNDKRQWHLRKQSLTLCTTYVCNNETKWPLKKPRRQAFENLADSREVHK
jgi:hypothetical protein